MATYKMPYSTGYIDFDIEDDRVAGVLLSHAEEYKAEATPEQMVLYALQNPIASPPLRMLAEDKKRVLIISSDHTRPVPSKLTMPIMLSEIRAGNPAAEITILIATGMHRAMTKEELIDRFGEEIVKNERIVVHDAKDDAGMVFKGTLPSGGELWLNKLIDETDFLMSEGFIEPHFFAGFSGGRKSVLPGIASQKTVLWNHNATFIANPAARTGNLECNPIHEDMVFACKAANLQFILNVVLNGDKQVIKAFSGHITKAHEEGCAFLASLARVSPVAADIVVTTNGGYPMDQNIYQAVKGMTAAEPCVNPGGVIIIAASCSDGHGGEAFYKLFRDVESPAKIWNDISNVPSSATDFDQWQSQILARVMMKAKVIVVTDMCDGSLITDMGMLHAATYGEALEKAEEIVGGKKKVTVIPDGIGVIVI